MLCNQLGNYYDLQLTKLFNYAFAEKKHIKLEK